MSSSQMATASLVLQPVSAPNLYKHLSLKFFSLSMSLTTSGQSMTFSVPLSSTVTHVLIEFTLSSGGGDLITQDDIAISID